MWRPDGREIAYVTAGDPKLIYYSTHHLALVPAAGGERTHPDAAIWIATCSSRNGAQDGRSIYFLIEDDRNQHLARIERREAARSSASSKAVARLARSTSVAQRGASRCSTARWIRPHAVYARRRPQAARADASQRRVARAACSLGTTEEISFASKDGTRISGFVVKPPGYVAGRRYPTLLWIHGGPVSQYANSFTTPWQIFAAHGYVVVGANPRGSSGRGEKFATAIYADWGNKDARGRARRGRPRRPAGHRGSAATRRRRLELRRHPHQLRDRPRHALQVGHQRRVDVATCWPATAPTCTSASTKRSSACRGRTSTSGCTTRIRSCTPIASGRRRCSCAASSDFNVPLLNSEQMYQALRSLGVDTQLDDLSRPVPRPEQAELSARPHAARTGLARQVPEGNGPRSN